MKYSNLSAFEKHLEAAAPHHFSEIYFVIAKESFIKQRAVESLSSLVLKGESSPTLCLHLFDAEKHSVGQILQELETLSFFSKKRVVVAHNVDAFDKNATLKLEAYAASPNKSVCFVATAEAINRGTTFYKKMEKVGIVLDIADEKPWEREKLVADWLYQESLKRGKELPQQLAQLLIKQLGTDQGLLKTELDKLICFIGERKAITQKDIAAISSAAHLDTGWQLGEAIFRRDTATALRISKGLLNEGVALIAFLRQIRSQFQTEFQVCSILIHGGGPAEVSQEFPYMRGTILDRHIKQSQEYGMQRFKEGLLAVDDAELQAKNGMMDLDFLTERLIIKLTSG